MANTKTKDQWHRTTVVRQMHRNYVKDKQRLNPCFSQSEVETAQ